MDSSDLSKRMKKYESVSKGTLGQNAGHFKD